MALRTREDLLHYLRLKRTAAGVSSALILASLLPAQAHTFSDKRSAIDVLADGFRDLIRSPADEEIVEKIKRINQTLISRDHLNKFGVAISQYEHPSEVEAQVREAFRLAQTSKNLEIQRSAYLREVTLNALTLLVQGRGATYDSTRQEVVRGTGWFALNRDVTLSGNAEIRSLVSSGLLDQEGRVRFEKWLSTFNPADPSSKTGSGFPPVFDVTDAAKISEVRSLLKAAPTAPDYVAPAKGNLAHALTLEELLTDAVQSGKLSQQKATQLLSGLPLEANHYDESVRTLRDPDATFIDYFGRKHEVAEAVDALGRIDKGHLLLTGRAGVGKTTILKILSDRGIRGEFTIEGDKPPLILEIPITVVTNQNDPTAIKTAIRSAQEIALATEREIILYIDEAHAMSPMTRQAVKGFLTEPLKMGRNQVHLVLSTTSDEAKAFLADSAFNRRFISVHIEEFKREETIQLIRQAYVSQWKKKHQKASRGFNGEVSDEAYDYAYKYASFEQPHAGNPTGTKELLEGAIRRKLNDDQRKIEGAFGLEVGDIQAYLRFRFRELLLPDDPEFERKFETKWRAFDRAYQGNDAFKAQFEEQLKSHFQSPHRQRMTSMILFGPPASGKSYTAERVAEDFFGQKDALLIINGADYKEGGLGLNKLIGSPTGTVGSEEQRSPLTKFIRDFPMGGVIVIEEADYLNQDVIQFLTNMNTSGKFADGLGKEYKTGRYILMMTSNIGQDLLIPPSSKEKMTWEQYTTRRTQLMETVSVNGKAIQRVRKDKLDSVFDAFVREIVTKSNPGGDTSMVAQEAQKQKRRYKPYFLLTPDRSELEKSAQFRIQKYLADLSLDFGVQLSLSPAAIQSILELDKYEFEKGHSYIAERLEANLESRIGGLLGRRGMKYEMDLLGGDPTRLFVTDASSGQSVLEYELERVLPQNQNPWGSNPRMMERIRNLPARMSAKLKGSGRIISETQSLLKTKSLIFEKPVVITQLGTTGNGKTEYYKVLAEALYDDPQSLFKISGLNHRYDLSSYFRPPTGVQGGMEETEFERWFKARQNAGGGIILFDELLSFQGLQGEALSSKIGVFNELYDLLDEGKLRIGNKIYDARAFLIGITGNSMQELFQNIPADGLADDTIAKIEGSVTNSQIVDYFKRLGFDAPKIARLGKIFVKGPLPRSVVFSAGEVSVAKAIQEVRVRSQRDVEFVANDELTRLIAHEKTSIELGMRDVNAAIETMIVQPYTGILVDIPGVKKVEVKLDAAGRITWWADGKEVFLAAEQYDPEAPENLYWTERRNQNATMRDRTPQVSAIREPKQTLDASTRLVVGVHEVYGHWMPSVLLFGENRATAINLEPGKGYGGYVAFKRDSQTSISDIGTIIRQAIVSEGGHRAVFLEKRFSAGGGAGRLDADLAKRSDDFASVSRGIDNLISNNLVAGLSEFSSQEEIRGFKEALHNVYSFAADYVIATGHKSGLFKPMFDRAMSENFIGESALDGYVQDIAPRLGSRDVLYARSLTNGVLQTVRLYRQNGKQIPSQQLKSVISRAFQEVRWSEMDRRMIDDLLRRITAQLDRPNRCNELLMPVR